jgi:hypothetical protein
MKRRQDNYFTPSTSDALCQSVSQSVNAPAVLNRKKCTALVSTSITLLAHRIKKLQGALVCLKRNLNCKKKYQPKNVTNHKNSQTLICIVWQKKNFKSPGTTGLVASFLN